MSLSYAGVSSDSVNVRVERYPNRPIPSRRMELTQIAGRSGDLLFDERAYNNVTQTYEIYIRETSADTFQKSCVKAAEWLLIPVGYQVLTDSYDPDTYRMGVFVDTDDVQNALNQFGRASINFSCKPFRYYTSGASAITITTTTTLTNPSNVYAEPTIVVYGSGAGSIGIGSYTVAISNIDDGMTIDCAAMDCYNGADNRNNLITLSPTYQYPRLNAGTTTITISGGITSLSLTPNWRTL